MDQAFSGTVSISRPLFFHAAPARPKPRSQRTNRTELNRSSEHMQTNGNVHITRTAVCDKQFAVSAANQNEA